MKKNIVVIIALAIVFVALFLIYIVRGGYYPAALVHGEWVSMRQFNREHSAYAFFYQQFGLANRIVVVDDETFRLSVGRDGLDRLVDDILIGRAVRDFAGRDARALVEVQKEAVKISPDIAQLRDAFGGIDEREFTRLVIEPRAERIALENHLTEQGDNFDDWIQNARRSARVVVFLSDYEWDGEKVVIRES